MNKKQTLMKLSKGELVEKLLFAYGTLQRMEEKLTASKTGSTKFLDRLDEILKGVPWAGAVCLKVEALRLVEKLRASA